MNDLPRRLAGRYELAEIIGRGGMGAVYRATDHVLDRTVAVKLLPAALAQEDPHHVSRFEREARATASLSHPGVVAVYDAGEDADTCFIVMECIEGRSLSAVLREEAPLEPARAAAIAASIAGALSAAHAAGIVHRDIKPGNVMLTGDGDVKVLDFGIARAADGLSLTQSASVLGTARYMAPEQALGRRADARSDIYALGCLLYAMLIGRPPFEGDTPAAVIHQQVNSDPVPPSALNDGVPAALEEIVVQMLAKSAAARPQDASRLAEQLSAAADDAPGPEPATATLPMPRRKSRVSRRRGGAAMALIAAVLLVLAVLALSLGDGSDRGRAGSRRSAPGGGSRTEAPATATSTQAVAPSAPQAPAATVTGAADAGAGPENGDEPAGQQPHGRGAHKAKKHGHGHREGD